MFRNTKLSVQQTVLKQLSKILDIFLDSKKFIDMGATESPSHISESQRTLFPQGSTSTCSKKSSDITLTHTAVSEKKHTILYTIIK